ncbi:hypothetical protein SO802_028975 [Lithocarpus litseifolius]|uniref:Uncharacterized protein n=1 Tax=Lithocarpus litseifolius TaxID=425828 RepID=A0AAW2BTR5_9ROSI
MNNDTLSWIPVETEIEELVEFRNVNREYEPDYSPLVQPQLLQGYHGMGFREFLRQIPNLATYADQKLYELDDNGKLLGFSGNLRKVFMGIAKKVIGKHKINYFYGDLLNRVRISVDFDATIPFDAYTSFSTPDIDDGKRYDVLHLRRMVALIIRTLFPTEDVRTYQTLFSISFNLFFSPIFDLFSQYSPLQFFHPIFFNAQDRYQFIHVVKDFRNKNPVRFRDFLQLENYPIYNLQNWWTKIEDQDLYEIYKYHAITEQYTNANGLPLYIRHVHHHLEQQESGRSHAEFDDDMHQMYPGYCAKILDACIRGFHETWADFERPLHERITESPFGFATE